MVKFVQTRMQGMNPEDLGEKTRMMPLLPAVPEPAIPEVAPPATVVRIYAEEDLPQEDTKRVEENEQDAHAKNTQRNYNTSFAQFRRWCEERQRISLPANSETVSAYLAWRGDVQQCKMATVRLDRAAIAWVHRDAGHDDPCRSYKVRKNLAGMGKRLGREQAQSKALTAEAMAAIRAKAYTPREKGGVGNRKESEEAALARGTLDVAICSVMRDGLLRRGEAAALCWRDVETDADGTFIKVERSKTDQEGETAIQFIGPGAAEDLEKIRPADAQGDDLVFALGERSISRRIRAAAIHAGLGDGYSGHSPRIGMAQDLDRNGAPLTALMTSGRWKTARMPAHYVRRQEAARGAVAQFYQGKK